MDKPPDPDQKKTNFWTSLPGILTGIAALVTAITGLTMGLLQHGVFSSDRPQPAAQKQDAPRAPTAAPDAPAPTPTASAPATSAARESTVLVTLKDGSVTKLLAQSFSQTAQYDAQLHLQNGQAIAFDKLASIEVERLHSDHARVKLTLVDGRVIDGRLDAGSSIYGFKGESELGTFDTRIEQLKRIDFKR